VRQTAARDLLDSVPTMETGESRARQRYDDRRPRQSSDTSSSTLDVRTSSSTLDVRLPQSSQPVSLGNRHDDGDRQSTDPRNQPFQAEGYAAATTAPISPSRPYRSDHYTASYPPSAATTTIPGVLTPVEARRTSNDSESSHRPPRQSLPSIREAFLMREAPPPASFSGPPQQPVALTHPLRSSFVSVTQRPTRDSETRASPRSMHPPNPYPPRLEPLPGLLDPARPPLPARQVGPSSSTGFGGQQLPPPGTLAYLERGPDADSRPAGEAVQQQSTGGYQNVSRQQTHTSQQPAVLYPHSGQLPPGQLPLPGPPHGSPRMSHPALPSMYPPGNRPPYAGEEPAKNGYEVGQNRSLEGWAYVNALSKVSTWAFL
jgi:hypothetical protein